MSRETPLWVSVVGLLVMAPIVALCLLLAMIAGVIPKESRR